MKRSVLKKKLTSLLHEVGPAEMVIALVECVSDDLVASAPPGEDPEDAIESVPELKAWQEWVDGELQDAASAAIALEDDFNYPPADQSMKPDTRGRGGVLEAIFPWMKK